MKTILYIEDNPANRILIGRVLGQDYNLLFAEDGETGLNMAVEHKPELILMDIGLPDFDGQTVGAMIRQIPELAGVLIIAITAWPEETAAEMVARYGFDGCITKPINVAEFPKQIASILSKKAAD
ncbi:MAG: response regulator [Ardenticatenaceae bacterium]|nr:response regulator [Ardenticatenaceae bacterium]